MTGDLKRRFEESFELGRFLASLLNEALYLKADKAQIRKEAARLTAVIQAGGQEVKSKELSPAWFAPLVSHTADHFAFRRGTAAELPERPLIEGESVSFNAIIPLGERSLSVKVRRNMQLKGNEVLTLSDLAVIERDTLLEEWALDGPARSELLRVLKNGCGTVVVAAPDVASLHRGMAAFLGLSAAHYVFQPPLKDAAPITPALSSVGIVVLPVIGSDPLSVWPYLMDSGYKSSDIDLVLVQSFARRTCLACARPTRIPPEKNQHLPERLQLGAQDTYLVGRGCEQCGHSGVQGIVGVQSCLVVSDEARTELNKGRPTAEVFRALGVRSLLEDGIKKVRAGQLTLESLFAVTRNLPDAYASFAGQSAAADKKGAHGKLLIVEDDDDQRTIIEMVLRSAGYQLKLAENGEKAIALAEAERPDLIVTDLMMPKLDGKELVKRLKAHPTLNDVPILVLTVVSDNEKEYDLLEVGADDYCEKTIQRKILVKRIENLLRRSRPKAS